MVEPLTASEPVASFGREVLAAILADRNFFDSENSPMWCELLAKFGYVEYVDYDPELHGMIRDAWPGQKVWIFTDAMRATAKGGARPTHPANLAADDRATAAAVADQIVTDILADLHGRVGLGQEWDEIEPDMQSSIVAKWRSMAENWIYPFASDLLRLCGPVCERDGKRAVEHKEATHTVPRSFEPLLPAHPHKYEECFDCDALYILHDEGVSHCHYCGEHPDVCDGTPFIGARRPPHPPAPAIETWLREHSK